MRLMVAITFEILVLLAIFGGCSGAEPGGHRIPNSFCNDLKKLIEIVDKYGLGTGSPEKYFAASRPVDARLGDSLDKIKDYKIRKQARDTLFRLRRELDTLFNMLTVSGSTTIGPNGKLMNRWPTADKSSRRRIKKRLMRLIHPGCRRTPLH